MFLVTIGPGELVWERFGHNALWISDPATGTDLAYNWGMFSFDQEGFLSRLLQGTMRYWMASFPMDAMVRAYMADDRSVWVQQLALTPVQAARLQEALRVNALPENAYYRYDYYRDNCSTRVRDALDGVLDGQLRRTLAGVPTGSTYRWHTRRLLQPMPLMYTGIQVVLSGKADRPIDRWDEAFLPVELMEAVRGVRISDGVGGDRPLVVSERQLYRSSGTSEPETVPNRLPWYLALGGGLAVLLLLAADAAARGRRWARILVALLITGWSLAAGLAGTILVGAWLFTDHVFWYPNENLFQLNPLSLALTVPALVLLARARPPRPAVAIALAAAALSLSGFLLQVLPGVDQVNGEILALTLPANLGVAIALLRLRAGGGEAGQG